MKMSEKFLSKEENFVGHLQRFLPGFEILSRVFLMPCGKLEFFHWMCVYVWVTWVDCKQRVLEINQTTFLIHFSSIIHLKTLISFLDSVIFPMYILKSFFTLQKLINPRDFSLFFILFDYKNYCMTFFSVHLKIDSKVFCFSVFLKFDMILKENFFTNFLFFFKVRNVSLLLLFYFDNKSMP